jgi:CheY-like chemotaxis protein
MDGSGKHILIIEDAVDLQFLLFKFFQKEGYQISQAYNGQQALNLLNLMPELPSVILLDLMMPVMDGIEFRQKQQSDHRLTQIPVIVMTADSDAAGKAKQLGVSHYLKKPIHDIRELIELTSKLSQRPEQN